MDKYDVAKKFAESINSKKIIKIVLFGSVARGDYHQESDIDILIVSNDLDEFDPIISNAIVNMIADYGELISVHIINEETFNRTKEYSFLTTVLKEGIALV